MIRFELKNILENEKMSQYKFSKLTKIRPNTISNIVNNNIKRLNIKSLDTILKELDKYGYSINDLINYTSEETKNETW